RISWFHGMTNHPPTNKSPSLSATPSVSAFVSLNHWHHVLVWYPSLIAWIIDGSTLICIVVSALSTVCPFSPIVKHRMGLTTPSSSSWSSSSNSVISSASGRHDRLSAVMFSLPLM